MPRREGNHAPGRLLGPFRAIFGALLECSAFSQRGRNSGSVQSYFTEKLVVYSQYCAAFPFYVDSHHSNRPQQRFSVALRHPKMRQLTAEEQLLPRPASLVGRGISFSVKLLPRSLRGEFQLNGRGETT